MLRMPKELVLDGKETLRGIKKVNPVLHEVIRVLFNFVPGMWIFNFIVLDRKNVYYVFLQHNNMTHL